ncbi:unnamed protein product [Darwinula stevensoni]|uniref:Transmembrane protein n=1 Tax=Darwinula stevensoni TaxID=69355 RepID=A0A7R8XEU7_9CRUS|nr:unnamed protein product [Darwinula stevensoni]CAG0895631.1 unnamed protein product [Darwinula stevensoni]
MGQDSVPPRLASSQHVPLTYRNDFVSEREGEVVERTPEETGMPSPSPGDLVPRQNQFRERSTSSVRYEPVTVLGATRMSEQAAALFNTVSSTFFPNVDLAKAKSRPLPSGAEVSSSLPLQICLHFNAYLCPFWISASVACLVVKFPGLSEIFQPLAVTIVSVLGILEAVRIYLGYTGNLMEKASPAIGRIL